MKIDIIIQARMGATRLPNKMLKQIAGEPILFYIVNRLRECIYAKDVIVATTENEKDREIVKYCQSNNIKYFVGSEGDVLERYYEASKKYNCDVIVRVTGDCPVVDPYVIDRMISYFIINDFDYMTNTHFENAYPSGFDCCIINKETLKKYHEFEKDMKKREHAFGYIVAYPEKYKIKLYTDISSEYIKTLRFNFNEIHLSVDTIDDFNLIQNIILYFLKKKICLFTFEDIMDYLNNNIELTKMNYLPERFGDLKKLNKK